MTIDDLLPRQRELYECRCPPGRENCSQDHCAPYRAYYDALFAGKSEDEARAAAEAATVPLPRATPSNNSHVAPRKPDGCQHLGAWQGKTCDEKT